MIFTNSRYLFIIINFLQLRVKSGLTIGSVHELSLFFCFHSFIRPALLSRLACPGVVLTPASQQAKLLSSD